MRDERAVGDARWMLRLASARNGDTPGHAGLSSIGESCQNKHVTGYGGRRAGEGGGGGQRCRRLQKASCSAQSVMTGCYRTERGNEHSVSSPGRHVVAFCTAPVCIQGPLSCLLPFCPLRRIPPTSETQRRVDRVGPSGPDVDTVCLCAAAACDWLARAPGGLLCGWGPARGSSRRSNSNMHGDSSPAMQSTGVASSRHPVQLGRAAVAMQSTRG